MGAEEIIKIVENLRAYADENGLSWRDEQLLDAAVRLLTNGRDDKLENMASLGGAMTKG